MNISDIGEFGWISRIKSRIPAGRREVLAGIGDDAAWLKTTASTLATCDLLLEDVHFLRAVHPPRLLGRKALSVNLSDLAAMAGIPQYALLAIGFPRDLTVEYADELIEGFLEVALEHKVELVGGDTTAADKLVISVTVLGRPAKEKPVLRSGAKPGDELWVTGALGDAALGFELLKKSRAGELDISDFHRSSLLVRHFDPSPRVEAGIRLAEIAHAMIDLSDGLMPDLGHILEESGKDKTLRAVIDLDRVPLSPDFQEYYAGKPLASEEALSLLLTGGEDYELLFTAAPGAEPELNKISRDLGLAFTKTGKIETALTREIVLLDKMGAPIKPPRAWFEHFPREDKPKSS